MDRTKAVVLGLSVASVSIAAASVADAQDRMRPGQSMTTTPQVQGPQVSPAVRDRIASPTDAANMWTQVGWNQGSRDTRINPDGTILTRTQAAAANVPARFTGNPGAAANMWTQVGWAQGGTAQRRNPDGSTLTVQQAMQRAQR